MPSHLVQGSPLVKVKNSIVYLKLNDLCSVKYSYKYNLLQIIWDDQWLEDPKK